MTANLPNPIDFTEILARTVSVDLGRSLQTWSDSLDGMSIALLSSRGNQVNRNAEDHGCRIIKGCGNSSG